MSIKLLIGRVSMFGLLSIVIQNPDEENSDHQDDKDIYGDEDPNPRFHVIEALIPVDNVIDSFACLRA